jgi:hypothetical protein
MAAAANTQDGERLATKFSGDEILALLLARPRPVLRESLFEAFRIH